MVRFEVMLAVKCGWILFSAFNLLLSFVPDTNNGSKRI